MFQLAPVDPYSPKGAPRKPGGPEAQGALGRGSSKCDEKVSLKAGGLTSGAFLTVPHLEPDFDELGRVRPPLAASCPARRRRGATQEGAITSFARRWQPGKPIGASKATPNLPLHTPYKFPAVTLGAWSDRTRAAELVLPCLCWNKRLLLRCACVSSSPPFSTLH